MTMSNKSFSIKENPYMKDIQGGEKKVMKKILSVALSTAMAFSMFASVAFGADAEKLTPEQQFNVLKEAGIVTGYPDGMSHLDRTVTRAELAKIIVKSLALEEVTGVASYKDKNYTAKHWAAPFIEAATKAGILEGVSTNPANPLFNPTGNVTVQELAKVLVVANKLEVPTDANNTASVWAKGYVAAAIKAGYIQEGINYQANATRSQTVVAAHAIYEFNNFKVTKAVAKDANNVTLTLSTGEVVEVKLEKALAPNVKTDLVYKAKDGRELKYSVTYEVTAATKIESVTATNLKELTVKFDGDVDKKTAETVGNYSVTGDATFKSATLSADKKEVKLLVNENSNTFVNQKEATLTVKGVKNGNASKTFDEKVKFTAVDNQLPTVTEVTGLGTKAIKVVFSEPVKKDTARNMANYRIDGKAISGSVEYTYPNIAFISTDVAVGAHKLTVQNVEDFHVFKVTPVDVDFTVAEDTTAPEIKSITSNDLNKVVVEFNEPVKSVKKAYHTSSSRTAESIEINDNKVTLTFKPDDRLSLADTTVYLEGVTDYSNNSADRSATVKPELDTTRPEVSSVTSKVNTTNTSIIVEFTKNISDDALVASNYVLRNEKGEIYNANGFNAKGAPVSEITRENSSKVALKSIGQLPAGKYSLEIFGIRDTASISNILLPTKVEFSVTSDAALAPSAAWYTQDKTSAGSVDTKGDTHIYVKFNRALATSGNGNAEDVNKYSYSYTDASTVKYAAFPVDSSSARLYSSDIVVITVPTEKFVGDATTKIFIANVADVNGNFVAPRAEQLLQEQSASKVAVESVKATDKKTVKIKFNAALSMIEAADFVVTSPNTATIKSATIDSSDNKVVNIVFNEDNAIPADVPTTTFGISVRTNPVSKDYYNRPIQSGTVGTIEDQIKPSVSSVAKDATDATKLVVTFDEAVQALNSSSPFTVYVGEGKVKVTNVVSSTNTVTLTLESAIPATGSKVYVSYAPTSTTAVIADVKGNAVEAFEKTITVAAAPVAATGLTVAAAKGTTGTAGSGQSVITVTGFTTGATVIYTKTAPTATVNVGDTAPTGTTVTGGTATLTGLTGPTAVYVYEVDGSGKVVKYGTHNIVAGEIE